MYSNKLYSPLRYPGGKAPFAPFIAHLMAKNGLIGGHYLEPYAGGAGVALELLFEGHASHIHINDADPAIYAFWMSVTKHSDELLALLESTPITM
jgi:DNA adenine methylase